MNNRQKDGFINFTEKKKSFQNAPHTIRALKRENRILKAEIKRLSRALSSVSQYDLDDNDSELSKLWNREKKEARSLTLENYGKYFWSQLTGGSLYSLAKRIVGYFRRFRLVSTVIRIISSVLTVVGTGAFFIFISGALVFVIPFFILFFVAVYFFGAVSRSQKFKELDARLKDKNIYVLFPHGGRPFEFDSCFRATVHLLASQKNNYIMIVSPYLLSSTGITGEGFYSVLRFENENVCIVRKHSFFALRKRILESAYNNVNYIY